MPGFKNVLFGGEGLFVTTLTGPGTVWLQGMPPDRMISEIARRVPSGGIGLGIPIGLGGGGGEGSGDVGGSEDGVVEGGEGVDGDEGDDLVAATDAATEMDRNATVASSGAFDNSADQAIDSESASALFGDAAPTSEPSESSIPDTPDTFSNESASSLPDMEETSNFSTDDSDFGEDLTQTQHFDDFANDDETSFSTEYKDDFGASSEDSFEMGSNSADIGNEEGGIGSILSQLWDFFTDDD